MQVAALQKQRDELSSSRAAQAAEMAAKITALHAEKDMLVQARSALDLLCNVLLLLCIAMSTTLLYMAIRKCCCYASIQYALAHIESLIRACFEGILQMQFDSNCGCPGLPARLS